MGHLEKLGAVIRRSTGTIDRMARNSVRTNADAVTESRSDEKAPNAVWFKPLMFGFLLIGLIWIIVFYVSNQALPIANLGNWNIVIGFGILFVGFLMTTRWR